MTHSPSSPPAIANTPANSDRFRLWLAAIKPPMYSVAIMPILWGTAIAYFETGQVHWGIFGLFATAAIFILAWENISNDVFDSETGIDRYKHHSLVNITQNKTLVFWIGNLFLLLGIGEILMICWLQHDLTVFFLILGCCALGYTYQGPPFRLGYQGLGEILCFFAFGPLAIGAVYYSQTQLWSLSSQFASLLLGITTSLVLFCSHFHQIEDDLKAGKRSPIVRLGTQRSAALLPWICGSYYGLLLLGISCKLLPEISLISCLGILPAIELCRFVLRHHDQPEQINRAKFVAIKFHFTTGILMVLAWGVRINTF